MAKFKIRKDDTVVVLAGKDKGRVGKVIRVLPAEEKAIVEGVNMIKRHTKSTNEVAGRIVEKEAPIAISNIALWDNDGKCKVKVAWKISDGSKVRVNKKTGATI